MKERVKKLQNYESVIIFGVIIFLFHLFFTRLFIKTDDGNFMGIIYSNDFTYIGWLAERYNTVSGRTVGEFLLSFFIKNKLVLWKFLNTLLIVYISCFWIKLVKIFSEELLNEKKQKICFCGIFLMFVSCINPSVFWFSGSFSYLWPFAGMIMTISPLVFSVLNQKVSNLRFLASFFFAFIGTMQEQAAACCTTLYLILLVITIVKRKKFNVLILFPLIAVFICDLHLFTAPGAGGRIIMEAKASFPLFLEYGIFQKISCGLASFFSNSYYLSNFLLLLFVLLLSLIIFEVSEKSLMLKKLLAFLNIFVAVISILINYSLAIKERAMPHVIFRNSFIKNSRIFLPRTR